MVLDDWIDGTGYTPDQVPADLHQGMGGMGGMGMAAASPPPAMSEMSGGPGASPSSTGSAGHNGPGAAPSGARSRLLGGDAGDVRYPFYLINGRVRTAPWIFAGRPGQRARIRFINAGADTAFRVALGVIVLPGRPVTCDSPPATPVGG